ncbi:MAG: nitronate monooxygenase [Candidatus Marinimicrobia bacterium]|jgi:nitronate monooxygenase|nr:nitronate monooxygenase [Candidatus Neomarinimicrobiota bacterium]
MKMPKLKIGNLTINVPIIQGGMGVGISMSGLTGAVTKEGGIGVIATAMIGMFEKDCYQNHIEANIRALRREIRKAREQSDGVLGVNIMVAITDFANMVKTSIEEKIDVIFSGAGLPLNLPQYLTKDSNTKLVPIVSSARAAKILIKKWWGKYKYIPDAFVVEGPKAGGHLGFKIEQINDERFSLEHLVKEVIETVKEFEIKFKKKIPVIAAGGIFTGKDIKKFLGLGASGVQMATRFVATNECDADDSFKQSYIDAKKEDTMIIKSPVGMPGRAIKNKFLDDVEKGKKKPFTCPYQCIITCDYKTSPYCIAMALLNAQRGKFKHGYAFAGENAYKVNKIIPVKELMNKLQQEYDDE